jgi:hypothetical protein
LEALRSVAVVRLDVLSAAAAVVAAGVECESDDCRGSVLPLGEGDRRKLSMNACSSSVVRLTLGNREDIPKTSGRTVPVDDPSPKDSLVELREPSIPTS